MSIKISDANVLFEDKSLAFVLEKFEIDLSGLYFFEGENGSGKTTLFKHLTNTLESSLYLDQNYYKLIFDYKPVWWNICLPEIIKNSVKDDYYIEAINLLKEFDINDLDAKKAAYELSGGEKHILLLLRCFLSSKKIILLDEPETGLDLKKSKSFWEALNKVSESKVVFLISHHIPSRYSKENLMTLNGVKNKKITLYKLNS